MDNNLDITGLRTAAQTAGTDLTKQISSMPGMLSDLKKSLVSIYSKDNPLIQARDTALGNYLSSGDQARAEFLPQNQPMVAGSPLNYSPTELNAMVSGRQSAALAPLLGLNQAVTQGYGNIGDILQAANSGVQGQISAAQNKATNALNLYKAAVDEYKAITERNQSNLGSSFLSGLENFGGGGSNRPPIESFDQPDNIYGPGYDNVGNMLNPPGISIPGQTGTIQPYTPTSTNLSIPILSGIGDWWHNLWNQPSAPQTGTGLNLLGLGGNTGPFKQ